MPAGEQEYVALNLPDTCNNPICPNTYILRRFAVGAAVAKNYPAGLLCKDFIALLALVIAVVPFNEITFDFCHRPVAAKLARSRRALQRTREHSGKPDTLQLLTKPASLILTRHSQWDVSQAGMLP